jgi:Ca-activated chloride channel homolog
VAPDTIELPAYLDVHCWVIRLGDLMTDVPRVILKNFYLKQLPAVCQTISHFQVHYDNSALGQTDRLPALVPIEINVQTPFQPAPNGEVPQSDFVKSATTLQTAAKTAWSKI